MSPEAGSVLTSPLLRNINGAFGIAPDSLKAAPALRPWGGMAGTSGWRVGVDTLGVCLLLGWGGPHCLRWAGCGLGLLPSPAGNCEGTAPQAQLPPTSSAGSRALRASPSSSFMVCTPGNPPSLLWVMERVGRSLPCGCPWTWCAPLWLGGYQRHPSLKPALRGSQSAGGGLGGGKD